MWTVIRYTVDPRAVLGGASGAIAPDLCYLRAIYEPLAPGCQIPGTAPEWNLYKWGLYKWGTSISGATLVHICSIP